MKLTFTDPGTLDGASLEGVISLEYTEHVNIPLVCEDSTGAAVDIAAKGMHQWKAFIVSSVDEKDVLMKASLPMPAENVILLDMGMYAADLFKYIAGRETAAAVLQLRGYAVADSEPSLVYCIKLPVLLRVSSDVRTPIDLQAALLEELAYAVAVARSAAERAERAYNAIPDVGNIAETVARDTVDASRILLEGYEAAAEESRRLSDIAASGASKNAADAAVSRLEAVEASTDAAAWAEGTDGDVVLRGGTHSCSTYNRIIEELVDGKTGSLNVFVGNTPPEGALDGTIFIQAD